MHARPSHTNASPLEPQPNLPRTVPNPTIVTVNIGDFPDEILQGARILTPAQDLVGIREDPAA